MWYLPAVPAVKPPELDVRLGVSLRRSRRVLSRAIFAVIGQRPQDALDPSYRKPSTSIRSEPVLVKLR